MAICDTLVLPNCESICIPWMFAEKDDWVPRTVAPFIWIKREPASNSTTKHGQTSESSEEKSTAEANRGIPNTCSEGRPRESNELGSGTQSQNGSLERYASSASVDQSTGNERSLHELTAPLLKHDEQGEVADRIAEDKQFHSPSQSLILTGQHNYNLEEEDARSKRIGARARMLGFGKKMGEKLGEKLEEKRRHIEERGRNIVEKMKGPQ